MPSVYSTASNDIFYGTRKSVAGNSFSEADRQVLIKGKATVSPGKGLITPMGVRTEVSQDDLDFLLTIDAFKRHMANGHITVHGGKKEADEVAKDMTPNDKSSPKMVVAKAAEETPVDIKKKAAKN